jgi:ABC-2 type transport system ATP-binding protein
MEEAERLCDRIVIMDHGRVIADDSLQGLSRLLPASNVIAIEMEDPEDTVALDDMRSLPGVKTVENHAGLLRVGVTDLVGTMPSVLTWLVDRRHSFRHVVTERADLEAVFLAMTGRTLRDR